MSLDFPKIGLNSQIDSILARFRDLGLLARDADQPNIDAVVSHQEIDYLGDVVETLHETGLLTGDLAQTNINAVLLHNNLEALSWAFPILRETGLLTGDAAQTNFEALMSHLYLWEIVEELRLQQQRELFSGEGAQAHLDKIMKRQTEIGSAKDKKMAVVGAYKDPTVIELLGILYENNLLSGNTGEANRDFIVLSVSEAERAYSESSYLQFPTTGSISLILEYLKTLNGAGLLKSERAQEYFDFMKAVHFGHFAHIPYLLSEAGLLRADSAQANMEVLMRLSALPAPLSTSSIYRMFMILLEVGLLTGDRAQLNFDAVARALHQESRFIPSLLFILYDVGLLRATKGQENFDVVLTRPNVELSNALSALLVAGLLTDGTAQDIFNALTTHSAIFLEGQGAEVWARIPHHLLTTQVLHRMIEIAGQNNEQPNEGQKALVDFVMQLTSAPAQRDPESDFVRPEQPYLKALTFAPYTLGMQSLFAHQKDVGDDIEPKDLSYRYQ